SISGFVYNDSNDNGTKDPVLSGYRLAAGLSSIDNDFDLLLPPPHAKLLMDAAIAIALARSPAATLVPNPVQDSLFQTSPQVIGNDPLRIPPTSSDVSAMNMSGRALAALSPGGVGGSGVTGDMNVSDSALAALSGYVFIDANNDGVRLGTEPGIPNVTVTL